MRFLELHILFLLMNGKAQVQQPWEHFIQYHYWAFCRRTEIRTSLDLVKEAPREVCKEVRKNGGFSGSNKAPRWRNMDIIQHCRLA
jgi:hypothetical protein